jgi:hypothetical protein
VYLLFSEIPWVAVISQSCLGSRDRLIEPDLHKRPENVSRKLKVFKNFHFTDRQNLMDLKIESNIKSK